MLTKKWKEDAEERLIRYFEKCPEDLEATLRVIQIYTDLDAYVPLIEEILKGSPFGEAIAKVTYEYRRKQPHGLGRIIKDEGDPTTYKVDPYVALSVAEVGKDLKEKEKSFI